MRILLGHIVIIFSLILMVGCSHDYKSEQSHNLAVPQDELIVERFKASLGCCVLTADTNYTQQYDSILSSLDQESELRRLVEYGCVLTNIYLLRGERQRAMSVRDYLQKKTKNSEDLFTLALSLISVGEVSSETVSEDEAIKIFSNVLQMLNRLPDEIAWRKIVMTKLMSIYIGRNDKENARQIFEKFSSASAKYTDPQTIRANRVIVSLINCRYYLYAGEWRRADEELAKAGKAVSMKSVAYPNYMSMRALLLKSKGEDRAALNAYHEYFALPGIKNHTKLYSATVRNEAELLEKQQRINAAFKCYHNLNDFSDSIAKRMNDHSIDTLLVRTQVEQLQHGNRAKRITYYRYYILALVLMIAVGLAVIIYAWRRIFKLRRSQRKLKRMTAVAEETTRKRSFFISNMSHEIRTPLNAIVGFSSLLATEDNTDEEKAQYLDIISVNSQQLLKLINDVLDISDLDTGKMQLNLKQHDVVKICRDTISSAASAIKTDVAILFDSKIKELMITTDDVRLRQVITNLVMNASKFTAEGAITLRLEYDPQDAGTLLFSVTDTGSGIAPEKMDLIFERFEKLNQYVQGTGLGLSICSLIMKAFNGKIWADREYKGGARFWFTHPINHERKL